MFFDTLKQIVLRAACGLALGFVAVSAGAAEARLHGLDVVIFSYLDHQIFDVTVGDARVGSAGRFPYNGRRTKTGVRLEDGKVEVSWRQPGTDGGESKIVTARNVPIIGGRSSYTRFMAVHIYPDASVDLKFSDQFPVYTQRGQAISAEYDRNKKAE